MTVILYSQAIVKLESFKCILILHFSSFLSTAFNTFPTSVLALKIKRNSKHFSKPHSGLFIIHTIRDTSCSSPDTLLKKKNSIKICSIIIVHAFWWSFCREQRLTSVVAEATLYHQWFKNANHIRWVRNSAVCPSDWTAGLRGKRLCSSTAWKAQWHSRCLDIF